MSRQNCFRQFFGVTLLLLLVGCAASVDTPVPATPVPPTPRPATEAPAAVPPTATAELINDAQDLVGTWFGFGFDGMYQRFNEDGSCQIAWKLDQLDTAPNVECTYYFDESRLVTTTIKVSGLAPCADDTATYEVLSLPNGNIKFVPVEETCAGRRNTTAQEHEPVR
jgi:hypothetical protein